MHSVNDSGKTKIWFVAPKMGVASEVWMYRQAKGMPSSDVQVLTLNHVDPANYPASEFSVLTVPEVPFLKRVWRKLTKRFLNVYVPSNRHREWYKDAASKFEPQVLFCQYGPTSINMNEVASQLGIPLVAHFHGYDLTFYLKSRPRYTQRLRNTIHEWAGCVVVAQYQRKILLDLGVEDSKIHVIPCGVPVDVFKPNENKTDSDICEFLSVGRLTDKKDPLSTIRAFDLCRQSSPNSILSIIGDGKLEQACRDLVADLGIENKVRFLGSQPTQKVREAMANASVFVQHSVTSDNGDMEGWPVSLAEAAASGLPIVSTRHASIPEQVIEGETGFLVAEGDWKAMGERMAELAGDAAKRCEFGSAGRAHISTWDTENQISQLENLLKSVATEHRSLN